MQRRTLLYGAFAAGAAGAALAMGAPRLWRHEDAHIAENAPALKGRLLVAGVQGAGYPGARSVLGNAAVSCSVITDINLETDKVTTQLIPQSDAHSPMPLPNGRYVCCGQYNDVMIVGNPDLSVRHRILGTEDYMYTGHPQPIPEQGIVVVPMKPKYGVDMSAQVRPGVLEVYDLETFKKLDVVDSGGGGPHEVRILPGGKTLVASHYGMMAPVRQNYPYEMDITKSGLSVLDARTLKVKGYYPSGFNAMVPHMDMAPDGTVYAVLAQFIPMPGSKVTPESLHKADTVLERHLNRPRDFTPNPPAFFQSRYAVPLPVLKFNPYQGTYQTIFLDPKYHMRGQSVAVNMATGRVFVPYWYSNTLVVVDADGTAAPVNGFDIAAYDMRGVCDIPGTPYVAVSGHLEGVSIIDARTLKLVKRYSIPTGNATHLAPNMEV